MGFSHQGSKKQLCEVCKLKVGVPVAPMLAKPSKEINEVLKRLSGLAFTMEYKYDGERAQVHLLPDNSVKIFSRNSEDNTEKYPDLKEVILKSKDSFVQSAIIDAEVVAYDRERCCLLPFQVLSTRKRKVESGEEDTQKVKVILQGFDMLFLNGKSLLRESLRTRREILRKSFHHSEQYLHLASGVDHVENGDTAPIESFLNEACNAMCEGLMVKTLDENATYEPSKRSLNWLKLKKDYINGMGVCDSVDLVPIGGYRGRGKRVSTYGAFLMACYDPDRDEFLSVCKLGTGFSDENLMSLTTGLKELVISSKKKPVNYQVGEPLFPDDWFDISAGSLSNKCWEVQAADLSRSSVHRGGVGRISNDLNDGSIRGIGLRFPRFLRERDDKGPVQATTSEQIVDLFHSQNSSSNNGKKESAENDDEDDWI
jgi:DNA ligase-1